MSKTNVIQSNIDRISKTGGIMIGITWYNPDKISTINKDLKKGDMVELTISPEKATVYTEALRIGAETPSEEVEEEKVVDETPEKEVVLKTDGGRVKVTGKYTDKGVVDAKVVEGNAELELVDKPKEKKEDPLEGTIEGLSEDNKRININGKWHDCSDRATKGFKYIKEGYKVKLTLQKEVVTFIKVLDKPEKSGYSNWKNKESPDEKRRSMSISYAKDLVVAKIYPKEQLLPVAEAIHMYIKSGDLPK